MSVDIRRRCGGAAEKPRRDKRRTRDDATDSTERFGQRRAGVADRVLLADIRRMSSHEEALSIQWHHVTILRRRETQQQYHISASTSGL